MSAHSRLTLALPLGLCATAAGPQGAPQAEDPSELAATVGASDLNLTNVCAWTDPAKRMETDAFSDCVRGAARQAEPQTLTMLAKAGQSMEVAANTVGR